MEPYLYPIVYAVEKSHWWYTGMRRSFKSFLAPALPANQPIKMVDVGCGTGGTLEEFGCFGDIFGFDLAWAALSFTKSRNPAFAICQTNLLELPVATAAVDVVLAFDVIEHVEDHRAALGEINRILRPDGLALINVPAFMCLWTQNDEVNKHFRRYSQRTLREVVEGAGFSIEKMSCTNSVSFMPLYCVRFLQRIFPRKLESRFVFYPSPWVNRIMKKVMAVERHLVRYLNLPLGASITCLARKHQKKPGN